MLLFVRLHARARSNQYFSIERIQCDSEGHSQAYVYFHMLLNEMFEDNNAATIL
jgi:hypothetical protein